MLVELWTRSRLLEVIVLRTQLPKKVPVQGKAILVVVRRILVELLHARAHLLDGPFTFHIQDIESLQAGVGMR